MSAFNSDIFAAALSDASEALSRAAITLNALKLSLPSNADAEDEQLDPKSPRNKLEIGGLMKLTPRGIEVCYRLFDSGKSRYAVCQLMEISFGAASHRLEAWKKLGGTSRLKQPLEWA